MVIGLISIIVIVFISVGVRIWYQKMRNGFSDRAACKKCERQFRAADIVSENLVGDGLQNSGKVRKISVTMRCPNCGLERNLLIYTEYRHSSIKGSPAHQYFNDLEKGRG